MEETQGSWSKWKRPVIIVSVILVIAGLVAWFFMWKASVKNDGLRQQNNVVLLQKGVELEISTCLDTSKLSAQVAEREYDKLKDVLHNVIAARSVRAVRSSRRCRRTIPTSTRPPGRS